MGSGGNIYVFDMGKSIKIVDLAENDMTCWKKFLKKTLK